MKAIIKREIKNFLKNPVFWAGLIIMLAGIYQILQPTGNPQNLSVSADFLCRAKNKPNNHERRQVK